jgi:hypothetical protein
VGYNTVIAASSGHPGRGLVIWQELCVYVLMFLLLLLLLLLLWELRVVNT